MHALRGRTSWRNPLLQDALGGVVLLVACVVVREPHPTREPWPWGWVLVLVAAVGLAVRRRYPVPALVLTFAAALTYYPSGFPGNPMGVAFFLTLYTVAQTSRVLWIVAVVAFATSLALVASLLADRPEPPADLVGLTGMLLVTAALGEAGRARRLRLEAAEERARAAAGTERLRIARELHDVLAHQISLIAVQSGAALHSGNPDRAQDALRAVNVASREALTRLREVLGVMRDVDSWRDADDPGPGLADLERLLEGVRATGLRVRFTPQPAHAAADVELVAYRIVQEALTNTVRHAGARTVDVEVRADGDRLRLRVSDDGRGTGGRPAGNGVRGMGERAAAVGGRVQVRDSPSGVTVTADLPIGGRP
ncbi:sensor histidine kinase [Kineococcus sp. SYSU DK003]|uniref:sensor histidine kinase n=1 Tax=Kineococcus sp. SYSU DK003 TaxID=3383124 RepID=UPI003D7EDE27